MTISNTNSHPILVGFPLIDYPAIGGAPEKKKMIFLKSQLYRHVFLDDFGFILVDDPTLQDGAR